MRDSKLFKKIIYLFMAFFFLISFIFGSLYYESIDTTRYVKVLMNVYNIFKTFLFIPAISIGDVIKYISADKSNFEILFSYLYMTTIIIAPITTTTIVFIKFENNLREYFLKLKKNENIILVFGFNDKSKLLFKDYYSKKDKYKDYTLICITKAKQTLDDELAIRRMGIPIIYIDQGALKTKLQKMFNKISNIIILENDGIEAFSSLVYVSELFSGFKLKKLIKCSFYCEDEGITLMVEDYINDSIRDKSQEIQSLNNNIDVEIINSYKVRIEDSLIQLPFFRFHEQEIRNLSLQDRQNFKVSTSNLLDVNLVVVGLGKLGKELIIQAIRTFHLHSGGQLTIHVFDKDCKKKKKEIASIFNTNAILIEDDELIIPKEEIFSDIQVGIKFYEVDFETIDFLQEIQSIDRITYLGICTKNTDLTIRILKRIKDDIYRRNEGEKQIPILVRMDDHNYIYKSLFNSKYSSSLIYPIIPKQYIYKLDYFIQMKLDEKAISFHNNYNEIAGGKAVKWSDLSQHDKESNRSAVKFSPVLNFLVKEFYEIECFEEKISEIIAKENLIDFLKKDENKVLEELVKLEHKRWNFFKLSSGYEYNKDVEKEKRELIKQHSCILNWDMILKEKPDVVKYDFISILAETKGGYYE